MQPIDNLSVNTIRVLSAEAINKSNSGHPGLPMGAAPLAYTVFSRHLRNNPYDLKWINRDRFVLSAGHGSMLLYSLFHLFGYGVTMDDIKSFRQWGSKTPGHPEYGHTPGVETTTGPLGMGVANAVGMAMAEAHLAAVFNKPGYDIIDHYTYVVTGDGCLEEGISAEASSLAGHLKLGKLILIYDRNQITIEGETGLAFTEDVGKRYEAYGWQVLNVADGNQDLDAIDKAIQEAKAEKSKPSIIIVNTAIGYGCPPVQGSSKCHGSPLGAENLKILKENLGFDTEKEFYVPEEVYANCKAITDKSVTAEAEWKVMFGNYCKEYPEMEKLYNQYMSEVPQDIFDDKFYTFDKPMATRQSSGVVLNRLAEVLPSLIGGSADLAPSNNSRMNSREDFGPDNYAGSNIHFGIREFAMSAIANGMYLHGGTLPYVATFFVFSDYLKHGIRLSALMGVPTIYVLTHDSIGVGEDGPTHEPIEQLAAARAIPDSYTWRPADSKETAAAYQCALTMHKPAVLALSRQTLPLYEETGKEALKGAYILKDCAGKPELILIGTGSEVEICMKAYETLTAEGIKTRVVSMPCMELFEEQNDNYKERILPSDVRARIAVEAGCSFGWERYVGLDGDTVTIDHFGASAPAGTLFKEFGFTAENIVAKAKKLLEK